MLLRLGGVARRLAQPRPTRATPARSSHRRMAALVACLMLVGGPARAASQAPMVQLLRHDFTRTGIGAASNLGWTSSNWSGYAVTAGPYTSATGAWTVPAVSRSSRATYSSSWVGIDGFNNSSLIQIGTEQDYFLGAAHYSAWWEILPDGGTVITSMAVRPGDRMLATIAKDAGGGTWTITLANNTTGKTFSTVQRYGGPGASAEWIQEAPTVGSSTAILARCSPTTFQATVNGHNPDFIASNGGAMLQNGVRVSTPSVPDSHAGGFSVRSTALPGAPTLRARRIGLFRHGIRLTWTAAAANGSPVTSYRIYRGTNPGGKVFVAAVGSVLTYADTGNVRDRTSYYEVVAVSGVGAGRRSNEATAFSN